MARASASPPDEARVQRGTDRPRATSLAMRRKSASYIRDPTLRLTPLGRGSPERFPLDSCPEDRGYQLLGRLTSIFGLPRKRAWGRINGLVYRSTFRSEYATSKRRVDSIGVGARLIVLFAELRHVHLSRS